MLGGEKLGFAWRSAGLTERIRVHDTHFRLSQRPGLIHVIALIVLPVSSQYIYQTDTTYLVRRHPNRRIDSSVTKTKSRYTLYAGIVTEKLHSMNK